MISNVGKNPIEKVFSIDNDKAKYLYPALIFFIWLIIYVICTLCWEQKIVWDENSYLSTAKGIVKDFDFSTRTTTVLGTIKYPFPQHTHHYPVYSTYLAIFFKLFGTSINVAYFSTWLCGLVVCIFVYLTMLLMTNHRLFSFFTGITFLFLPRIVDYCDSAMMEVPGCALVSIFTYFIFKDISKGKINIVLLAIAAIWLYFFKSLFIGIVFGFIILIFMLCNVKQMGLSVKTKRPWYAHLFIYLGVFSSIYFIFTKYIFLPLAPMMNFDRKTEILGTYADFAGGFFHNPINNAINNFSGFIQNVVIYYFPRFPMLVLGMDTEAMYNFSPAWLEFGLYYLIFIYIVVFLFLSWKELLPVHRAFIVLTITSILILNTIFNLIAGSCIGVRCRYNLLYVPLLLISSGIILWVNRKYFLPFMCEYKKGSSVIALIFILLVYVPLNLDALRISQWNKDLYHGIAHKNAEIVRKFVGNINPMFIYFNTGQHTNWDLYPMRVVLMDMSNDQLKLINHKLPKPIEFLFLQPENPLFKENEANILKGQPIVDNSYVYYGVDLENKVVVYRLQEPAIGAIARNENKINA